MRTPSSGKNVLDRVETFLARYVAFPDEASRLAVVLWVAHTHLVDQFESTPRLAILSPEPGSGKSRVLETIDLLVPKPMRVLSASPAAIFRSIAKARPTLLLDEVDTVFGAARGDGMEDLRGLLNAGHRRGAHIPRCVGPTHDVQNFPVFAAVALAGLGDLPETIMTRSVVIRMRRRRQGERVGDFRARLVEPEGEALSSALCDWAATVAEEVGNAWPDMPEGVTDRPADVWAPLLAVADAAGAAWPTRARIACVALVMASDERSPSLGVQLLHDLRTVFAREQKLATNEVLKRLNALPEAPWGYLAGRELDSRRLAKLLRQYAVSSVKVRVSDGVLQGYRLQDRHDPFERYLPTPGGAEHPEHSEQPSKETMKVRPRTGDSSDLDRGVLDVLDVPDPGRPSTAQGILFTDEQVDYFERVTQANEARR